MTNIHDEGDMVRLEGTFTDPDDNDALIDPSVVSVSYRKPDGTVTTKVYGTDAEVIRDSKGLYHADIVADQSGRWTYRWHSDGTGKAAEQQEYFVEEGIG